MDQDMDWKWEGATLLPSAPRYAELPEEVRAGAVWSYISGNADDDDDEAFFMSLKPMAPAAAAASRQAGMGRPTNLLGPHCLPHGLLPPNHGPDYRHPDFHILDLPPASRKNLRRRTPFSVLGVKDIFFLRGADVVSIPRNHSVNAVQSSSAMQPPEEFGLDDDDSEDYYGLAYLDFEDSRYIIKRDCVIIGRPPDGHLTLSEVPGTPAQPEPGFAPTASTGQKRKRSAANSAENNVRDTSSSFQGGLGGPQEHGLSYNDENAEFLSVWPPVGDSEGTNPNIKAISKRHLCIMCDESHQWRVDVLGRNGAWINSTFHPQGDRENLADGAVFWLANVKFSFNIPEEDTDGYGNSDEELYDSPENDVLIDQNHTIDVGDIEDEDEDENLVSESDDEDEDEDEDDEEEEEEQEEEEEKSLVQRSPPTSRRVPKPSTKTSAKSITSKRKAPKSTATTAQADGADDTTVPKKRGPGRPPKDGVMSKRARRALQKAAEAEREEVDPSMKQKGRPRKAAEPAAEEVDGETKKAKKPKRPATDAGAGNSKVDKEDKVEEAAPVQAAPPPPPREPSPKESDFQEHELQKPDKPYSHCLYTVLTAAGQSMSLPEIYEAFKKRWPYFRFRVAGDGWQSSIRHNLQSTKCLVKGGKAGKGYLWTVDPNIPLNDRSTRPDMPSGPQPYFSRPGQGPAMLGGPNSHVPMQAPHNHGFQGQQNMQQYHMYMQHNPHNQRQPPPGAPPSMQHAQAYQMPQSSGTSSFAVNNLNSVNWPRQPATGGTASTANRQSGTPAQKQGEANRPATLGQPSGINKPPVSVATGAGSTQQPTQTPGPSNQSSAPAGHFSFAGLGPTWAARKFAVFENFRTRLLVMATNEKTKAYYREILDFGQEWCARHNELDAPYDEHKKDVSQIVTAFHQAWRAELVRRGWLDEYNLAFGSANNSGQQSASAQPVQASADPNTAQPSAETTQTNGITATANNATNLTTDGTEKLDSTASQNSVDIPVATTERVVTQPETASQDSSKERSKISNDANDGTAHLEKNDEENASRNELVTDENDKGRGDTVD